MNLRMNIDYIEFGIALILIILHVDLLWMH